MRTNPRTKLAIMREEILLFGQVTRNLEQLNNSRFEALYRGISADGPALYNDMFPTTLLLHRINATCTVNLVL